MVRSPIKESELVKVEIEIEIESKKFVQRAGPKDFPKSALTLWL